MPLEVLTVSNFRSLKNVELTLNSGLNFFYGDNGAGKTSILECISLLGLGRSFKSRKHSSLPTFGESNFTIFAKLNKQGELYKIGLVRGADKESHTVLNSIAVNSSSVLAELFPFRCLDPHSLNLLEGSPSERRSYIDWLMFHVKHDFKEINKQYNHCLKQRNALLRHGKIDETSLRGWTDKLKNIGIKLQNERLEVLPRLERGLNEFLSSLEFLGNRYLDLKYIDGNKQGLGLSDSLQSSMDLDLIRGFTHYGPHKADLKFTINRKPISEVLSRGQLKSVVYALYMAQVKLVSDWVGSKITLLIDDISSELDARTQKILAEWVEDLNIQVFVTGITKEEALRGWSEKAIKQSKMFHVKHGEINEERHYGAIHD